MRLGLIGRAGEAPTSDRAGAGAAAKPQTGPSIEPKLFVIGRGLRKTGSHFSCAPFLWSHSRTEKWFPLFLADALWGLPGGRGKGPQKATPRGPAGIKPANSAEQKSKIELIGWAGSGRLHAESSREVRRRSRNRHQPPTLDLHPWGWPHRLVDEFWRIYYEYIGVML
jgi:hypothetical protein